MVGVKEVVEATLRTMNHIEVRGRDSVIALSIAMENLENIVKAFSESNEEAKEHDADDGQGQDV